MAVDVDQKTRLERYAELAVRVGANVQEGQLVVVVGLVEEGHACSGCCPRLAPRTSRRPV